MGKIILVASGKGGVGKTTVCSHLAAALSQNKKVLVVDADFAMPNLDLVYGQRNHVYDIQDLFKKTCELNEAIVPSEIFSNLSFLFAPQTLEVSSISLLRFLKKTLLSLRSKFNYILVDCPSGADVTLDVLADHRFSSLIVATADMTSVSDAQRVARYLEKRSLTEMRLIVNRVRSKFIRDGDAPDIDFLIDSVTLPLLGLIPEDTEVIKGQNFGTLVFASNHSKSKPCFERIALRIQGEEVPLLLH